MAEIIYGKDEFVLKVPQELPKELEPSVSGDDIPIFPEYLERSLSGSSTWITCLPAVDIMYITDGKKAINFFMEKFDEKSRRERNFGLVSKYHDFGSGSERKTFVQKERSVRARYLLVTGYDENPFMIDVKKPKTLTVISEPERIHVYEIR